MTKEFIAGLVVLCKQHNVTLFPRTDGRQQILAVMVGDPLHGETWMDFKRISGDGAEPLHGVNSET
jgi:hypothetical protein